MDAMNFDRMTRLLSAGTSRRQTFGALALGALGLAAAGYPSAASAKKRKNTTKKPKLNAYGCVNVGAACRGSDDLCCSGLCEGKKPKKGKKDSSRCVAHHVSGCDSGQDFCATGDFLCGAAGYCYRTTGKASFCGVPGAPCRVCQKDADCQEIYGPGAACVVCELFCPDTGTVCVVADA